MNRRCRRRSRALRRPQHAGGIGRAGWLADDPPRPWRRRPARREIRLLGAGRLLGLLQQDPEAWFQQAAGTAAVDPAWVQALLDERVAARKARAYARADAIRAELAARNIVIEDSAEGARWKIVTPAAEAG